MSEGKFTASTDKEPSNAFDDYKKTCSIVFGQASQSQLKYIQAFSDLQYAMWTSCDGIVAKQVSMLEEYSKMNPEQHLELPLRIYGSMIDVQMKWVSAVYDMGVVRLQFYRNNAERLNEILSFTKDRIETMFKLKPDSLSRT